MAIALCLVACTGKNTNEKDTQEVEAKERHADEVRLMERQVKAVGITLGQVEQKNLSNVVRVSGLTALNPQDRADVTPLVGGTLRSISVIEGSSVRKGQVVAWLENTEIVAMQRDFLQNLATLTGAESELRRQRELASAGAGVEKNLQKAEADYQIAFSAVMGLGNQLRQMGISEKMVKSGKLVTQIAIKAPISGNVDKIYKVTGSYADTQQPILSIVDNSRLHIDINVFEKDMANMAVGQHVDFVLTNNPAVRLSGVVYEYSSSFTSGAKSIIAHVRITSQDKNVKLIPDMYVTGTVECGRSLVSAVPEKAITSSEGKNYIFALEKTEEADGGEKAYHFRRIEVAMGAEELGYVQITPTKPLSTNTTVVTAGAFYLSSVLGDEAEHGH